MSHEKPEISKSFSVDGSRNFKVDYYVTDSICQSDGADEVTVYGLRLDLFIDGKLADTSKVDDVSPSKETVVEMARLFARNLVTPASLKDVVEDSISAQLNQ